MDNLAVEVSYRQELDKQIASIVCFGVMRRTNNSATTTTVLFDETVRQIRKQGLADRIEVDITQVTEFDEASLLFLLSEMGNHLTIRFFWPDSSPIFWTKKSVEGAVRVVA